MDLLVSTQYRAFLSCDLLPERERITLSCRMISCKKMQISRSVHDWLRCILILWAMLHRIPQSTRGAVRANVRYIINNFGTENVWRRWLSLRQLLPCLGHMIMSRSTDLTDNRQIQGNWIDLSHRSALPILQEPQLSDLIKLDPRAKLDKDVQPAGLDSKIIMPLER